MYLTIDEYERFGGKFMRDIEASFPVAELSARSVFDSFTFRRLVGLTPDKTSAKVKMVMTKLIDLQCARALSTGETGRVISSESNDGVSVSYAVQKPEEYHAQVSNLIETHLSGECCSDGVPLLYAGRSPRGGG